MKYISALTFFLLLVISFCAHAQNLEIYSCMPIEDENTILVSISDKYQLSEHPDSLSIPNIEDLSFDSSRYFKLDTSFRYRFLNKTSISESDSLYIYDYADDQMKKSRRSLILLTIKPVKYFNHTRRNWKHLQTP